MLSINFKPPEQILSELGTRAKQVRLALNLSRQSLAERSGVPASTIKRFETTGLIGSASLVDILFALDRLDELSHLFAAVEVPTIAQLDQGQRKRGRR